MRYKQALGLVRSAHRLVELSFPEYSKLRAEYWRQVNSAILEYLDEPTKDEEWLKAAMRAAIEIAFVNAAAVAFLDGSGERELTVSLLAFVTAYKIAEFGFVESLVLSLRSRKYPPPAKEEEPEVLLPPGEVTALRKIADEEYARKRADGYSQGLDILYNNVKVRSAGEKLLLFTGDDGMESCFDCQKYKGIRKPASWWVRNNAVPPNRDFECKGYKCMHVLVDKQGNIFTI